MLLPEPYRWYRPVLRQGEHTVVWRSRDLYALAIFAYRRAQKELAKRG